MTYTVEIQKEYALRILEDLQLLNAIRFHEVNVETPQKEKESNDNEPELTKEELLAKVVNALNDVKRYKRGEIKLKSAREFLNEL